MNPNRPLQASSFVVALGLLLGAYDGVAADEVAGSFDRMLAHRPAVSAPITAADREKDPLLQAVVIPLRDGVRYAHAKADPIADSFARMLAHTPNRSMPAVPSNLGADPLIAAIVEPLRESFAAAASTTRLASARATTGER
jgi:hypothetical protein